MKRALITGITGQDGRFLAQFLTGKGYQVFGLIRGQNNPKGQMIVDETPSLELVDGDLRDLSSLIAAVEQVQPDEVYNLGAISFVKLSWTQPELTAEITGLGVLRMLEAVRIVGGTREQPGPLLPGVVVGDVRQGARDAAERAHTVPPTVAVRRRQGVRAPHDRQLPRVVRDARVVGHPLQPRDPSGAASSSSPARSPTSLARIKLGLQDSVTARQPRLGARLRVRGRLRRGDVADAPAGRARRLRGGDRASRTRSASSSTSRSAHAGYDDWKPFVHQDARFERPAEVDLLRGDATKAREKLGWFPRVSFEELVKLMYANDLASERAHRPASRLMPDATPLVGVIMGSDSDLRVMQDALDTLDEFDVPREVSHRVRAPHPRLDVRVRTQRRVARACA